MRISLFFITFFSVIALTLYLLYKRFAPHLTPRSKKILASVLMMSFVYILLPAVIYRQLKDYDHNSLMGHVMFGHYLLLGVISFFAVMAIQFSLLEKITFFWMAKKQKKPVDLERREFLGRFFSGSIAFSGAALSGLALHQAHQKPQIKKVSLPIKNLPPELSGFKVAQISDVHIGPTLDHSFLQTIVDELNGLNADVVAITGDLVDGRVAFLGKHLRPLKNIKSQYGTFFCSGNHESYWNENEWEAFLSELGIKVLRNSNVLIGHGQKTVMMAGIPDRKINKKMASAIEAAKTDGAADLRILLAHRPEGTDEAIQAGFHLQLSGHTHAGQFYPWTHIGKLVHPYFEGQYFIKDSLWLYVNPGTGYWGPPLRTNRTEITFLELVSAT